MNVNDTLILARKHLGGSMESSALLCLTQAIEHRDAGAYDLARQWAIRSLSYSVGILHPDYQRASKAAA
jgi:hypothetical protein